MKLTFVESRVFTARWRAHLDDDRLRDLQKQLLQHPAAGDPIPGCPIMRKLRFGDERRGKGKRSGFRVIYVHTPEVHRIDFITVYSKDEADDLTKDQTKQLCRLAQTLRDEARRNAPRSTSHPTE